MRTPQFGVKLANKVNQLEKKLNSNVNFAIWQSGLEK
jgi:hypothetical protein